jgi:hypothetical protein
LAEIRQRLASDTSLEVWFQDEMRVGQKNKLTYRWATKGSRPRAVHDQRTQSTYVFGAVCPVRGAGAALVLPACNTEAMQLHLDEIATKVTPGAHAVVVLDQAGWHKSQALKVPSNISLMPLPPRSPELIPRKTSGSSCATIGCQTASSNPSTMTTLLCLEYADRPTLEDHVLCSARLGNRASGVMRLVLRLRLPISARKKHASLRVTGHSAGVGREARNGMALASMARLSSISPSAWRSST